MKIYSYWLGSRTIAVLFDPRMDLLPEAAGWGQQIRSSVNHNCCCPRSQSITVLLYTIISKKIIHFFHSHIFIRCFEYPRPSSPRIGTTFWHCEVNITWLREPMKIRPWVNSSVAGNRSMNCWPVNGSVLQLVGILLLNKNVVYLLYWFYIGEKMMLYNKYEWKLSFII